jgi:hypothetical protein
VGVKAVLRIAYSNQKLADKLSPQISGLFKPKPTFVN